MMQFDPNEDRERTAVQQACTAAIRHIGIQKKTSGKIRNYLHGKEYDADTVESALEELADRGYIDDRAVAVRLLTARSGRRSVSKNAHRHYLKRAGIPADIVEQTIQDLPPDEETAPLALEGRFKQSGQAEAAAMVRFLRGRGYSPALSVRAVSAWIRFDADQDQL